MTTIKKHIFLIGLVVTLLISSCQQPGGESPGSEFMPDMAHSIAYEANYYNYYYNNTWGSEDDYYRFAQPRLPVKGTIPRSTSYGSHDSDLENSNSISFIASGSVPYYYEDTEAGRTLATEEIVNNPYKITDAGLSEGKELYITFCAICHGEKGDGAGYLVRDDGGKYPVQPAILNNEEFTAASNGRMYHAIVYGKNLMGGYTDKLGEEERWQVIHYIRALQAKTYKKEYNQFVNTLNTIDLPMGEIVKIDMEDHDEGEDHHGEEGGNEGSHDQDNHNEESH